MSGGNFAGGNGTSGSPFLVEDAHDLNAIRNNLAAHYRLINNIDLNVSPYNAGEGWLPIGGTFAGTLDGAGFFISNLFINRPGVNFVGLINWLGGNVLNLGILRCNIRGAWDVGAIAGWISGSSPIRLIENCVVTGSLSTSASVVGSIVGRSNTGNRVAIRNCHSFASINNNNHVGGGIAGSLVASDTSVSDIVENCYYAGVVIGTASTPFGIVGSQINAQINGCYIDQQVSVHQIQVGLGRTTAEMHRMSTYVGWDTLLNASNQLIWFFAPNSNSYPRHNFTRIRFFIIADGIYKTFRNGLWQDVIGDITGSRFIIDGIVDPMSIPVEKWQELKNHQAISIEVYDPIGNTNTVHNITIMHESAQNINQQSVLVSQENASLITVNPLELIIEHETETSMTASDVLVLQENASLVTVDPLNFVVEHEIKTDMAATVEARHEVAGLGDAASTSANLHIDFEEKIELSTEPNQIEVKQISFIQDTQQQIGLAVLTSNRTMCLVSKDSKHSWQAFKNNQWIDVELSNIATQGMTKEELEAVGENAWKQWFVNYAHWFHFDFALAPYNENTTAPIHIRRMTIEMVGNSAPIIKNPRIMAGIYEVGNGGVINAEVVNLLTTIEDPEKDLFRYRLFVNNVKVFPEEEWSHYITEEHNISHTIDYRYLHLSTGTFSQQASADYAAFNTINTNSVVLTVQDKRGMERSWTTTFVLINGVPQINLAYNDFTTYGTLYDPDNHKVAYRILINGGQAFPIEGNNIINNKLYTEFFKQPFDFYYSWSNSSLISVGEPNTITFEAIDELNGTNEFVFNIIGKYMGLSFKDGKGKYLTNLTDGLLNKLDFGEIDADQTTPPRKVTLENASASNIDTVEIKVVKESPGEDVFIEISELENPFIPVVIQMSRMFAIGETKDFFVRVRTDNYANFDGNFSVSATANPVG